MHFSVVVFAVIASLVGFGSAATTERISVIGALRDRIEQFRRQMVCGVNGGPPLAPLHVERFDLNIDQPPSVELVKIRK